jgi:hypothetical protein
VAVTVDDVNGDGRAEVLVRTPALAVTLNPARGGTLTEIASLARRHDLADVLGRRPEAYHERLVDGAAKTMRSIHDPPSEKEPGLQRLLSYDRFRRACLLDGMFGTKDAPDPVEPWATSLVALGEAGFTHAVVPGAGAVEVRLHHRAERPAVIDVEKWISVRDATLRVRYRLAAADGALEGRWGVQWNLALSAGDAPGRYLTLPGQPSLGSAGRVADIGQVTLVDEWLGLAADLAWQPGAELSWGPVETVSVSEGGFERIYQGLALLLVWPLAGASRELEVALTVRPR